METNRPFDGIAPRAYNKSFEHISDVSELMLWSIEALYSIDGEKDELQNDFREGLAYITAREKLSAVPLRLVEIKEKFNLNDFETTCVMLGISAETDENIGNIIYKKTRKPFPDYWLALSVCSLGYGSDKSVFDSFKQNSVLRYLCKDAAGSGGFVLSQKFCLRRDVTLYLTEQTQSSYEENGYINLYEEELSHIKNILSSPLGKERAAVVLHGKTGSGRRSLAKRACGAVGKTAVIVVPEKKKDKSEWEEFIADAVCACMMKNGVLVILADNDREKSYKMAEELPKFIDLVLLCDNSKERVATSAFCNLTIDLPPLSISKRRELWEVFEQGQNAQMLAERYHLSVGQIKHIAASVNYRKNFGVLTDQEIIGREVGRQNIGSGLCRMIHPAFGFDDLAVDDKTKSLLRDVCLMANNKTKLYETSSFGALFPYGRGLGVLFHGISGTGKTMAVQVIGKDLGLDIMAVDLSVISDKYIGETEKHLSEVFEKAKENNCVLFFDEADSLFSNRTEVSDSLDRHANAQTAHLLQKMEEYDGLVILATNLLDNVDDAFKRRLPFIIGFSRPDADLRKELWRKFIPKDIPQENIDFDFLGETFELTPAVMKWAAFSAAVKADKGALTMEHILDSLRYEYEKTGTGFPQKEWDNIVL